jgi:hypothetical protein
MRPPPASPTRAPTSSSAKRCSRCRGQGQGRHRREAVRLLRPGGRYAVHELAFTSDTIDDAVKTEIRQALARSISVNARPQTVAEWTGLLEGSGSSSTT